MEDPVAWRLAGRGRPGDEESGSKGGRRVGAGRFVPAVAAGGGSVGSGCFDGDESIMFDPSNVTKDCKDWKCGFLKQVRCEARRAWKRGLAESLVWEEGV